MTPHVFLLLNIAAVLFLLLMLLFTNDDWIEGILAWIVISLWLTVGSWAVYVIAHFVERYW
jgi:hypothetical protein